MTDEHGEGLRECGHCGAVPSVSGIWLLHPNNDCILSGYEFGDATKDTGDHPVWAIAAWNRRTPPAASALATEFAAEIAGGSAPRVTVRRELAERVIAALNASPVDQSGRNAVLEEAARVADDFRERIFTVVKDSGLARYNEPLASDVASQMKAADQIASAIRALATPQAKSADNGETDRG